MIYKVVMERKPLRWHLEDLFARPGLSLHVVSARIDRDGSGDIVMEDFFVFFKEVAKSISIKNQSVLITFKQF